MRRERIDFLICVQIVLLIISFAVGLVSLFLVEPLVTAACILIEFVTFYNMAVLTAMYRDSGLNSEENRETDSDDKER